MHLPNQSMFYALEAYIFQISLTSYIFKIHHRIFIICSKEGGMTVLARQPIRKGDPIYHSYAREFTTTTFRRLILFSGL